MLKGDKKSIIQIIAKRKYLYKYFFTTITLGQDLWDIITIVIVLNLLYKPFDTTIASLLGIKNKMINQI